MLILQTALSLCFLAAASFLFWRTLPFKRRTPIGWLILFIVLALPLVFLLYKDVTEPVIGANIGLGLAFFFTWTVSAIMFLTALWNVLARNKNK